MATFTMRPLLALALLAAALLNNQPLVLSSDAPPTRVVPQAAAVVPASTQAPTAVPPVADAAQGPTAPATVVPVNLALEPCGLDAHRAACEGYAGELAAYGLDIEELTAWTSFGLQRFVEGVERLADAFGGGGNRAQRIARFSYALGTDSDNGRILVVWQDEPQARDGNPVRGGYAANRLYFNPNTLFLDMDTPAEALGRAPQAFWWLFVHELAHLWDERSAPVAQARHSAVMRQWVYSQGDAGLVDEHPSSYSIIGGPIEAFADAVAATVTGDAAVREFYGSPRDNFVKTTLCEAVGCR